jgi:hypothetical protein
MVVDSNNVLYMFFGNRVTINGRITHGMWYSIWQGDRWSVPVAIVSGQRRDDFDPSFANAVVSQGNVVLLTWMTDPGAVSGGTYYSHTVLDAPDLPLVAVPTPALTPTSIPTSDPHGTVPNPSPTSVFVNNQSENTTWLMGGPALPLILGIIPVGLLVSVIIVLRSSTQRSQRR